MAYADNILKAFPIDKMGRHWGRAQTVVNSNQHRRTHQLSPMDADGLNHLLTAPFVERPPKFWL